MNAVTEMTLEIFGNKYPNMMATFGDHVFAASQEQVIRSFVEAAIKNVDEWIAQNEKQENDLGRDARCLKEHLSEIDFGEIFMWLSDYPSNAGPYFVWHEIWTPGYGELIDSFVEWDMIGDPMSVENIGASLWRKKGIEIGKITWEGDDDFECLLCDGTNHRDDRFEIFDRAGNLVAQTKLKPFFTLSEQKISEIACEHADRILAKQHAVKSIADFKAQGEKIVKDPAIRSLGEIIREAQEAGIKMDFTDYPRTATNGASEAPEGQRDPDVDQNAKKRRRLRNKALFKRKMT